MPRYEENRMSVSVAEAVVLYEEEYGVLNICPGYTKELIAREIAQAYAEKRAQELAEEAQEMALLADEIKAYWFDPVMAKAMHEKSVGVLFGNNAKRNIRRMNRIRVREGADVVQRLVCYKTRKELSVMIEEYEDAVFRRENVGFIKPSSGWLHPEKIDAYQKYVVLPEVESAYVEKEKQEEEAAYRERAYLAWEIQQYLYDEENVEDFESEEPVVMESFPCKSNKRAKRRRNEKRHKNAYIATAAIVKAGSRKRFEEDKYSTSSRGGIIRSCPKSQFLKAERILKKASKQQCSKAA